MRRLLTPIVAALVLPASAVAQAPPPAPPPGVPPATVPPPKPPPKPKPGKASIRVSGGQATKARRYVPIGAAVRVRAKVSPYVAGERVTVELVRGRRVLARKRARVHRRGRVSVRFTVRRGGPLKLRVRHRRSVRQAAFRSRSVPIAGVRLQAGYSSRGLKVLLLQRGLRRLGYAVPRNGWFDPATARAVTAFRKVNRLGRSGFADTAVYFRVLQRRGAFKPRYPRAGHHFEFDWSRQVLALINRGRAYNTYHASSGKPSTPTVFGTYRFYRRDLGVNAKGMVHAAYFIRGYAVHGYASVPNYPASHGCIRVPVPDARYIRDQTRLGMPIMIYR